MAKPGFSYRPRDSEHFLGVAVDSPKHDKNTSVLFRTGCATGITNFHAIVGPMTYEDYRDCPADVAKSWLSVPTLRYDDFDDLFRHMPMACNLVGVELCERAEPLETFVWPKRSLILLGGETDGLSAKAMKSCRYMIRLPGAVSMNLSACASICIWDWYCKTVVKGVYRDEQRD